MEPDYASLPYVFTNAVAVLLVITAMVWPTIARGIFSSMFVAAFAFNLFTAFYKPSAYLYFAEHTTSGFYKSIILGPFSDHVTLYIMLISLCQLYIGVFISYKGRLMQIAMFGGIIFLIAISPLGYGAAFPSTLIMASGLVILLAKKIKLNVYEIIYQRRSYSRN
jgi:hypothetical protein